jgi:hypothetical protein
MAEHEPDGINEVFASSARVALTAGGLVAERMIREREQAFRQAEAESRQAVRDLQARLNGERTLVRRSLHDVQHDRWWAKATAQEIGDAWQTARAWQTNEPNARWTVDRMRDELRRRYAIDVDSLDADPAAVQDALERRERALRLAVEARESARVDEAVAAPLMVVAGRGDRDQDCDQATRADALYDSVERRRDMAADLEGVADGETIDARIVADTNQALPAEEAVTSAPKRVPAARRSRGKAGQVRGAARRSERGR